MLGIKDEEKQRNAIIKLSDIKSNTIYKNVLSHYKNLLQENEEFLEDIGLVIVDEAHNNSFRKIFHYFENVNIFCLLLDQLLF